MRRVTKKKKTVLEKIYSSQQIINYTQHLALPPIVVNIFDTDGWVKNSADLDNTASYFSIIRITSV